MLEETVTSRVEREEPAGRNELTAILSALTDLQLVMPRCACRRNGQACSAK